VDPRYVLPVQVRSLTADDLESLARSLGHSHAKYFRKRMPLQRSKKALILVALHNGLPVGAVFVMREPAEERAIRRELGGTPLLHHVCVKEQLRGRTVGTQLLKATHEELRGLGYRRVALGVDLHNKNAIRLYERLGYEHWENRRFGQRRPATGRVEGERPTAYEIMVLDLEHNDRTQSWGSPTKWRHFAPVLAAFRPGVSGAASE
jgi:ribosomal protein S18 acetylase RimI-like enzyme